MPKHSISQRLPNSPSAWPADAFAPLATFAALCGLIFVYFATLFVLLRVFHVSQHDVRAARLTPALVATQLLGYVPLIAYLGLALPALAKRGFAQILGPLGAREVLAGFSGAVLMWLAVIVVGTIQATIVKHAPSQLAIRIFEGARPGLLLDMMVVIAVVVAPLSEELVFRAFLFNALWRRFSLGVASTLSGLIFGMAHGEAAGVLPLAAGGIVLASVYARSGSLWSSVIAHGTFNGITLVLLLAAGIKT